MHKKLFTTCSTAAHKESLANQIVYELMLALNYLHKGGRIHRDVKLENLMCEESGSVKLADFGFATRIGPGTSLSLSLGSPLYIAPEIASKQPYD
jgi:serine/threonine protein kinase